MRMEDNFHKLKTLDIMYFLGTLSYIYTIFVLLFYLYSGHDPNSGKLLMACGLYIIFYCGYLSATVSGEKKNWIWYVRWYTTTFLFSVGNFLYFYPFFMRPNLVNSPQSTN